MARLRYTDAQRRKAIKELQAIRRRLGAPLFGWAIRKLAALESAERRVAKLRRDTDKEIAQLRRSAGL